jgi:DUF4097 and DUF4098 domain-containing protein YvlB
MYEFERSTPVTIALRALNGRVDVIAEERGTVAVDLSPYDDSDNAREAARRTRVALEDDTLLIQVPGTEHWIWRRAPKLRITVRVPAGSALTGRSAAAPVQALGVYSLLQLDVASADVQVEEITGDVQLDAASGDLEVGRVGGALRAKSASGTLRIGDVIGDVAASTASGDISVRSGAGSLHARSASGDIEIGRLRQGQAQISTASGDVQIGVAPGTGVWLDLDTASGRSISDLTDHRTAPPTTATTNLELRVRTASGDISVYRAPSDLAAA